MKLRFFISTKIDPMIKSLKLVKLIATIKNDTSSENTKYLCLVEELEDRDKDKYLTYSKVELDSTSSFLPMPSNEKSREGKVQRTIMYCAGPSGSGKSTIVNSFVDNYSKLYPRNLMYMFSKVEKDPSIGHHKNLFFINNFDDLETDPIDDISMFESSLVIMDDIDTMKKHTKNHLKELSRDIGECGRHHNISMCITSHEICKKEETKLIISESHIVVMYLSSGYSYDYYLQKYLGMSSKQIAKLKKIAENSRWVAIYKQFPVIILTQKLAMFLSDLDS
jgi:hypothetical protein